MGRTVFLDTETTELMREVREVWDIGGIVREPGKDDREFSIIVTDVDFSFANTYSLKIGHAYERHPRFNPGLLARRDPLIQYLTQAEAAAAVEEEIRDACVVGIVPDFDTFSLEVLLNRHGLPWTAYYQPLDVEVMVAGFLHGQRSAGRDVPVPSDPPWDSFELSRAIGVEPPGEVDLHTGLGDARWARDLWDVVTGRSDVTPGQPLAA